MKRNILILGIHDGHNCGATLTLNGKIVASVCEERITRKKNEVGFPEKAIMDVLRIAGASARDLDEVAFASEFMHAPSYLEDLVPWYIVGKKEQERAREQPQEYRRLVFEQRRKERIGQAKDLLGVDTERISFVEHHTAHLAAAYYTNPFYSQGRPVLGITCDGSGDGIACTVSVCRDNTFERIAVTNRHASLGKIYSRVTMLMGMTPWEHEYKVMGLAPYADPLLAGKAAEPLKRLLTMREDGLGFAQASELSTNYSYYYLRDAFERVRFDTIAGAVQTFTEDMLLGLVRGSVKHTGIRDVVLSGGVFMNVKANMLISQLDELKRIYVMPSGADESLSIGACLHRYYEQTGDPEHEQSVLNNLYLGGGYSSSDEERALDNLGAMEDLEISRPENADSATAKLLARGEVVARCRGRMEWGARALGNRSILARADDYRIVSQINDMIKMRDFWMPFAPSILAERAGLYFEDPKDQQPWFMITAFPAKKDRYGELVAGSHPKDRTIRPQVVTREGNPGYHELIGAFEARTGMGALLNTSFNLHGYPIVYSPRDAVQVFLNSGLRHLALEEHLISKRSRH